MTAFMQRQNEENVAERHNGVRKKARAATRMVKPLTLILTGIAHRPLQCNRLALFAEFQIDRILHRAQNRAL